ncbi:MAG: aspartyl protease family protein [Elusimicrobiota bacterium]
MGITYIKVKIGAYPESKKTIETDLLVDTGAYFSVVPCELLTDAGIKPRRQQVFTLANGKKITRQVGYAVYKVNG